MADSKLYDEIGPFTAIPNSVIQLWPQIGPDGMSMFLYLRFRTNGDSGQAFPSYDKIQADTGIPRRRISKAIRALMDNGLVERRRRFGSSTLYILKMPRISATPEPMPSSADAAPMESISATPERSLVRHRHTNKIDTTKTEKKPHTDSEDSDPQTTWVGVLARVCQMDATANGGRLGKAAKALRGSPEHYRAQVVMRLYKPGDSWWYKVHRAWIKRKNPGDLITPPSPEQILSTIQQALAWESGATAQEDAERYAASATPAADAAPPAPSEAEALWARISAALRGAMPRATFETHFGGARPVALQDSVLTVELATQGSLEVIRARMGDAVTRALSATGVSVCWMTREAERLGAVRDGGR